MKEYNEIGKDEMLEWARMNGIGLSEGQAKDLVSENDEINLDEWFKQNNVAPIGEYEDLVEKMKIKIQKIILSLKEKEEKTIADESSEMEEKDTLDEKDGKEELDNDKKEEVEERKRENGEEKTEDKKDIEVEEKDEKKEEKKKQEEITGKEEYLAKVKKLHQMKIADYKEQMKKDDVQMDKYFVTMIQLQSQISKNRKAFIKEYGTEELEQLENGYLREELKYQKTLDLRMERDLSVLRRLNEKLDSILDRMQTLQISLEKGSIDTEEYNEEINGLEKEKLDTLWQINRLNPSLLEEKQDIQKARDVFEQRKMPKDLKKGQGVSPELKAKQSSLNNMEKRQEGIASDIHEEMKERITDDVNKKEKRLDELRNELSGLDIESSEGKKRALEIIGEIQTLESQKMSQEKQLDNMEKNMKVDDKNYSDLQSSENDREDNTKAFEESMDEINPEEVSTDLMAQLKNQALKDPSTPAQAEEYLDNINETSEDIEKEQDKDISNDDVEPPTLWNRRKRPY